MPNLHIQMINETVVVHMSTWVCVWDALALKQPTHCGEKSCRDKVVRGGGGLPHLSPLTASLSHTHITNQWWDAPVFIYYSILSFFFYTKSVFYFFFFFTKCNLSLCGKDSYVQLHWLACIAYVCILLRILGEISLVQSWSITFLILVILMLVVLYIEHYAASLDSYYVRFCEGKIQSFSHFISWCDFSCI